MKTFTIALAASMLFVAMPLASASLDTECPPHAATSYIEHPVDEGRYLWIDAREPNKLGEWTENNRIPGLQTAACFYLGVHRFAADKHLAVLP